MCKIGLIFCFHFNILLKFSYCCSGCISAPLAQDPVRLRMVSDLLPGGGISTQGKLNFFKIKTTFRRFVQTVLYFSFGMYEGKILIRKELLRRPEKITLLPNFFLPRRDILLLANTSLTKQRRLSAKSYFGLKKDFFTLYLGETFLPWGNKRFRRLNKIRIRNGLGKEWWRGGKVELR